MLEKNEEISIRGGLKPQIAKYIYRKNIKTMKDLLSAGEWKYEDRKSDGYQHYKKLIQNSFYNQIAQIFSFLESCLLIEECGCDSKLEKREGWKPCLDCNGCGYKNTQLLNNSLAEAEGWNDDPEKMIQPIINELLIKPKLEGLLAEMKNN